MNKIFIISIFFTFFLASISSDVIGQQKDFSLSELKAIQKDGSAIQTIESTIKRSKNGDSYHLMGTRRVLGGLNSLIKSKYDVKLINYQQQVINSIINSAKSSRTLKSSFNDNYLGWVSKTKGNSYLQEAPLYEGYSFVYIAEFLYLLQKNGWKELNVENKKWWDKTLAFIEKNVWEKWINRSEKRYGKKYTYFLRSQTHMGSHWAGIALYLEKISPNQGIRIQSKELYTSYDLLLKRNFQNLNNGYVWNSTYDNVNGTDAISTKSKKKQDTSHGNHVVSYILAAYELGDKTWTNNDINLLVGTLKNSIYDRKSNSFRTYVNGADNKSDRSRFFLGDGWVKLGKYDSELAEIFNAYSLDNDKMKVSNQEFQFKSNLFYLKNLK